MRTSGKRALALLQDFLDQRECRIGIKRATAVFWPGAQLELSTLLQLGHGNAGLLEPQAMAGAIRRIDDVEGELVLLQTFVNERERGAVLVLRAIEKCTGVSADSKERSSELR